jgi:hypothetical protein
MGLAAAVGAGTLAIQNMVVQATLPWIFPVFYAIIACYWLSTGYQPLSFSFLSGALLLPWLIRVRQGYSNWPFALLTVGALVGSLLLPSRTLHFFTVAFATFYALGWIGGPRSLPIGCWYLASPSGCG